MLSSSAGLKNMQHLGSFGSQVPNQVINQIAIERNSDQTVLVKLSGEWRLYAGLPSIEVMMLECEKKQKPSRLCFDTQSLAAWDSGLLITLQKVISYCEKNSVKTDLSGLPGGVINLLKLSCAPIHKKEIEKSSSASTLFSSTGGLVVAAWSSFSTATAFLGDVTLALSQFFKGKARFRAVDFWIILQDVGIRALPIVSLISILVGLILAFVGSIQLKMFGAQIYIADLVGVATVRAMGAIMTGIIMAGRTGASYAAGIGTMEVNEEIDALKTSGISPVEFLVLPRILALTIMMPLLTIYADVAGIIGGFMVGVGGFGISPREYYNETLHSLTLTNVVIGLVSSIVFGILIGFMGCFRGMKCGRSASAVGDVTTSAVVSSIIGIIVATAIITVVSNVLGF